MFDIRLGKISQFDVGAKDVCGKQCTGTAASFLCHMHSSSVCGSQEIDDIITWGTHHYAKIGNTFEPKGSYRYLQVNEVCIRPVNYKNKKYNLQLVDEYFGMMSQKDNDIDFGTYSLINAVEMSFKKSSKM